MIFRIGIKAARKSGSSDYGLGINMTNSMPIENGEKKVFPDTEKIVIDSINLAVEIYESDVEEVTIQDNTTVQGIGKRRSNKVSYKEGVLSFKQVKQKSFLFSVRGNIVVEVPKGSVLEYDIESISGGIRIVANPETQKIISSSISGAIKIGLEKVSGYEMDYSTISSSVRDSYSEINYSKSGTATNGDGSLKIDAQSISGSISLTDWQ